MMFEKKKRISVHVFASVPEDQTSEDVSERIFQVLRSYGCVDVDEETGDSEEYEGVFFLERTGKFLRNTFGEIEDLRPLEESEIKEKLKKQGFDASIFFSDEEYLEVS